MSVGPSMLPALIVLAALAAAWFTYWRLERMGVRAWPAAAARAVAWAALGLLLADTTCRTAGRSGSRPLVLLDGSLSMTAAGGHWSEARDSALSRGEVRLFGDAGRPADSLPSFGRSELGPALRAATASDRPVLVITDGELDDPAVLDADTRGRIGLRSFPRDSGRDLAIGRVSGPDRVTAGDTIRIEADLLARGAPPDTVRVELRLEGRVLGRRSVPIGADGTSHLTLEAPSRGLSGDVLLSVALAEEGDREVRDNARLWLVRVTPTPGLVLLASPPDWDARFLYRALRDVARLPVRGYVRLERGIWRSMETLTRVPPEEVRRAARGADLLVVKGEVEGELTAGRGSQARWLWPSGEGGEAVLPGDWYASPTAASPVAGAFVGAPLDSFPPFRQLTPIEPAPGAWVGLVAQAGRRGAERPVLTGWIGGGGVRREVRMAADGLWAWAFRGGASEEAYRALVAATVSWLLGGADSSAGRARPLRPVVAAGRPVVFEWSGAGAPVPLAITLAGERVSRRDTLRFDGAGRAAVWLAPGRYRYRIDGGGEGPVVVDRWSSEWFPHGAVLSDHPMPAAAAFGVTSSRRWLWLFALAVVSLCVEWALRRRLGLR